MPDRAYPEKSLTEAFDYDAPDDETADQQLGSTGRTSLSVPAMIGPGVETGNLFYLPHLTLGTSRL